MAEALSLEQNSLQAKKETPRFLRWMIYFYFFISFYEPYLNGVLGAVTKYYIFALMLVALIASKKFTLKTYHFFYLFWLVYLIASLFWTRDDTIMRLHFLSQVGMVALLVTLTAIPICQKTISGIMLTMWLSSTTIGILALFFSAPYHGEIETRLVLNLFGQEIDPNNQAIFLLTGIALALHYILIEKRYRILSLAGIAINFYTLTMTGSRGGLVSAVLIIILYIILNARKVSFGKNIGIMLLFLISGFILFTVVQKYLPEGIFDRLFTTESYENSSNRDLIWKNVWELYTKGISIIFGSGWGAYYGYKGIAHAVHNTYLAMLSDVGIIGFITFFAPIVYTATYLFERKEITPICILFSTLIPIFFLDAINKRFFWNPIILLLMICNFYIEMERKECEK